MLREGSHVGVKVRSRKGERWMYGLLDEARVVPPDVSHRMLGWLRTKQHKHLVVHVRGAGWLEHR